MAYKLCVSTLFVPILFSVFIKSASKKSAASAMLVGFLMFVFTEQFITFDGKELLVLGASAVAFKLGMSK